ncbi:MAG: class I SAM-dependent methyltransferase [Paracoccaceae bacterium]
MTSILTSDAQTLPDDFDPQVYLDLNEDVKKAKVDAAKHYLNHGRKEGRAYKRITPKTFEEALAEFLTIAPAEQNAFDMFPTAWSSAFDGVTTNGTFKGEDDGRIKWLLDQFDATGASVLELGPLEAGHTVMLERAGAKVLAIESNKGAFLRSLIVKNYLNLRAKFLLGDFEKMDLRGQSFDLVVASGVLYHMKSPVQLLESISGSADRLFIWTHYFEPDLSKWNPALAKQIAQKKWKYDTPQTEDFKGLTVRTVKQHYGEALGWSGFCGGSDIYSNWVYREDLLAVLAKLGFKDVKIAFDHVHHANGPAFCLYCTK